MINKLSKMANCEYKSDHKEFLQVDRMESLPGMQVEGLAGHGI